ncbi:MAG: NAD(P)H-dependent oxidoreductase subunit E [Candidatus Pacearchaeota archaeon]
MKKEGEKRILLNILNEAQDKYGYLSENILKQISEDYDIPIAKLYGVVKFYTMLRTEKQGKYVIELCGSPSCVLNGSREIERMIKREFGIHIGETSKDGMFSVYKTSCIGCCDEAPAMLINGKPYTKLSLKRVKEILTELKKNANS